MKWVIGIAVLMGCVAVEATDALENQLFTVRRDQREAGSGFLLHDGEQSWLVSNCHVVEGDADVEFVGMTDSSRVIAMPDFIDVAANRDAVRFASDESGGFSLGSDCSFDDVVFAFGNSDGKGVVTKSEGTVVGKGRGEIEVTCDIIPGNSGGPVINESNEVVGISTFLITPPSDLSAQTEGLLHTLKMFEGTRYEKTRRFAVPVHDADWQRVERAVFRTESIAIEPLREQVLRLNSAIISVFLCAWIDEECEDVLSHSWVRRYHRKLKDCGYYHAESERYWIRSGRRDSFNRSMRRWLEDLSETAAEMADALREESDDFSIQYYRNEIMEKAEGLERSARDLLDLSVTHRR